jgi:hypothetical protein
MCLAHSCSTHTTRRRDTYAMVLFDLTMRSPTVGTNKSVPEQAVDTGMAPPKEEAKALKFSKARLTTIFSATGRPCSMAAITSSRGAELDNPSWYSKKKPGWIHRPPWESSGVGEPNRSPNPFPLGPQNVHPADTENTGIVKRWNSRGSGSMLSQKPSRIQIHSRGKLHTYR